MRKKIDTSDAQKYCIDAKPTDFYFADEESLCLNSVEIERALSAALRCQQHGPAKAAMILVCKLADGYRQYEKKRREFKNGELLNWWPMRGYGPIRLSPEDVYWKGTVQDVSLNFEVEDFSPKGDAIKSSEQDG